MTTKDDLRRWFQAGVRFKGERFMIVICDQIDWTDYPVYVYTADDVRTHMSTVLQSAEKVIEVYDLEADMEEQMAEHRAWRI